MRRRKIPKTRNPMARAVRTPEFRMRVIRNKKLYSRKARTRSGPYEYIMGAPHGF